MYLSTSLVSALVGFSSLVVPSVALSAADADTLYGILMQQPHEERVQTLRHLDTSDKTVVLISRINDYRDTHPLNEGQTGFLDKVIEHVRAEETVSSELRQEAKQFFDFEEFRILTSTVRDLDVSPPSAKLRKRAPDCNCATGEGECDSGQTCIESSKKTCAYQINECGPWYNDMHCTGKCYAKS